ncbi:uncharacterized protein [Physcomitrium patens]|uniref:Uncharacterized protein n=1 Tax=Physcomitrium patens TaxID=3218 RepID=A0A7I4AD39_PHYPA
MDGVVGAQHTFSEALEALGNVDVEENVAEGLVHDARAAVDVLSDALKGLEKSVANLGDSSNEQGVEKMLIWVDAVNCSWRNVVTNHNGVSVAERLGDVAPNLCASWLDALKVLGSCAVVAKGWISRPLEGEFVEGESNGELSKRIPLVDWTSSPFLIAAWPELKGRGGLGSSRWRARVSAVEFLSSLAEYDLIGEKVNDHRLSLLEELLRTLIFRMGLVDSHWQVRRSVLLAVTRLLMASLEILAKQLWASLAWGVLAFCTDPHTEVQLAAKDIILHQLLPSSELHSQVVVQSLLDRFISAVLGAAEDPDHASDSSQGNVTLVAAIVAAVQLELVPHKTAFEVQEHGSISVDRIPILLVATSVALSVSEKEGNKDYSASLLQLIRCFRFYPVSLLSMLNPKMALYECEKLAKYCKRRGVLDEVTAMKLEKVPTAVPLKALAAALEASESTMRKFSVDDGFLGSKQLDALQHISEMLHIPHQLTRSYKDKATEGEVESYLECGMLHLKMALMLVKNPVWTAQQAWQKTDVILDIFLSFSALASGIIESEGVWVDKTDICMLCNEVLACFSHALQIESSVRQDEAVNLSSGYSNKVPSLETLVLRLLPGVLLKLKDVLKASTRSVALEKEVTVPKMDDLPTSIISAHQLRWCLVQIHYPNFKPQSEIVIRTALTALDHYSPPIKKQGMKSFIHLATNIDATELCWFKDAILDAVTRSLIGCEELWPVAVEMTVALVTRIEGGNPRGQWYQATMKEMLEDLERHRRDQKRRVVWLQLVTPQFESMGIMLVAHFKRLLPLLYYWLHAQDEETQLLVLTNLRTIIRSTWPRIPFHVLRMQEELMRVEKEGRDRKSSPKLFAAIGDLERFTLPAKAGFS